MRYTRVMTSKITQQQLFVQQIVYSNNKEYISAPKHFPHYCTFGGDYRQTCNIRPPNPQTWMFLDLSSSCLCPINWSQVLSRGWWCSVVWAAPIGDIPTTSEWSTISLLTKVRVILEVYQHISGIAHHIMKSVMLLTKALYCVSCTQNAMNKDISSLNQFESSWIIILAIRQMHLRTVCVLFYSHLRYNMYTTR